MTVLPTNNKDWGFWGTAKGYIPSGSKMQDFWDAAFTIIQAKAGFTPQETLALLDSRWGRHTADGLAEELSVDVETFTKTFKHKVSKAILQRDFNYYVDPNAYKQPENRRYENFCKDLKKLSKTYGIVLQVVGGVNICTPDSMKGFNGYTTDLDSGDLEPI